MPKPTMLISIETNKDTVSKDFGRSFIESLCNEDPRLIPEKLSETENYKDPYLGVEDYLENWWAVPTELYIDDVLIAEYFEGRAWKRKSALAGRGKVKHGGVDIKNRKIPSRFWFESRWARDVDFNHLFEAWVGLLHCEIGMLHLYTDAEKPILDGEHGSSFEIGSFGGPAKPGIANMGWAMAYGQEHIAEVDVTRIKAAGFPIDVRDDGIAIVRVTEKLSDVVDDFEHFSRRRSELKSFFRPDLFRIKDEPSDLV